MGSRRKQSAKRSSTSSKLPEPPAFPQTPLFVVDQSIGGLQLVEALRAVGVNARKLDELVSPNAIDPEVFAVTVANGGILLTHDKRMRKRDNERAAIISTRVVIFMPTGTDYRLKIEAIVKARFRIVQWVGRYRAPFVARILQSGKLEMVDPFDKP